MPKHKKKSGAQSTHHAVNAALRILGRLMLDWSSEILHCAIAHCWRDQMQPQLKCWRWTLERMICNRLIGLCQLIFILSLIWRAGWSACSGIVNLAVDTSRSTPILTALPLLFAGCCHLIAILLPNLAVKYQERLCTSQRLFLNVETTDMS